MRTDVNVRALLAAEGVTVELKPRQVLFRPGDACGYLPLLLEGRVRVQRVTRSGKEIILYRIGEGEMCVLSTACLLSAELYAAEGIAETPGRAIMVSAARFTHLLGVSALFRQVLFAGFSSRITDLMDRMEQVLDVPLEARLAELLLRRGALSGVVDMTHQELALELATAREVVTRTLKRLAQSGHVAATRGHVTILRQRGLAELARDAHAA